MSFLRRRQNDLKLSMKRIRAILPFRAKEVYQHAKCNHLCEKTHETEKRTFQKCLVEHAIWYIRMSRKICAVEKIGVGSANYINLRMK